LIELNEKQSLVADIREEVIFPDEIKNVGPPQPQEKLKCFARLTVCNVPDVTSIGASQRFYQNTHSSARHSIRIVVPGPLGATIEDDGALSNSDSRTTMTDGMS